MDKNKGQSVSALDAELQGTWVVLRAYQYGRKRTGRDTLYPSGDASWYFCKGKAVYTDLSLFMRMDYTYRIERDILTLFALDTDAECADEPEQYRVLMKGKYATFCPVTDSVASGGEPTPIRDAYCTDLMKI